MTLILYYHELSDGRPPLSVTPELFSQHLAVLESCGATVLTVSELVDALRNGGVPERTVALTFDDTFAAAVDEARPRLATAGMRATFFCVAGHLGGSSDWPSQPSSAPVRRLASSRQIVALARDGHEIGSHGWSHAPLDRDADLEQEIVASQTLLAGTVGEAVRCFAYPYGAPPTAAAQSCVEQTYDSACSTVIGRVGPGVSRYFLPRVDAHYVRDPRLLRRVIAGSLDAYLVARRLGSQTRRAFRKDYAVGTTR